jgi:hypothetical protein
MRTQAFEPYRSELYNVKRRVVSRKTTSPKISTHKIPSVVNKTKKKKTMGLLKHGILPLFGLLHIMMSFVSLTGQMQKTMTDAGVLTEDYVLTEWEDHLMVVVGGVHMMLLYGCVMGVLFENAHFRGILIVMEGIFFGTIAYSDYGHGYPYPSSLGATVLAIVGAVVHSMEPGLLTKDKAAAKEKSE